MMYFQHVISKLKFHIQILMHVDVEVWKQRNVSKDDQRSSAWWKNQLLAGLSDCFSADFLLKTRIDLFIPRKKINEIFLQKKEIISQLHFHTQNVTSGVKLNVN